MKNPNVLGSRITAASPHEESKGSPLLWTAASPGAPRGRDLRRDNYTDSILCTKVLQKYADTFSSTNEAPHRLTRAEKFSPCLSETSWGHDAMNK